MNSSTHVLSEIADPCPELIALTAALYCLLLPLENRKRRRSGSAQRAYDRTLIAIVAAIATNAMSEVPPHDGLAFSRDDHNYTGGPYSAKAMRAIMDGLDQLGFVVRKNHYYDEDCPEESLTTCYRHTWEFRDLAIGHGFMGVRTVYPPNEPVFLNEADPSAVRPDDVIASEAVVERYNAFTESFTLSLPGSVWLELEISSRKAGKEWRGRPNAGFNSQKIYLRRVFTRTYARGGRWYGGWWINMPSKLREKLLIDGEATVELDYVSIHPTLIAAEKGFSFIGKPYEIDGYGYDKAVGKRMFFRVLNAEKPVRYDARKDKKAFGTTEKFYEFRDAMLKHLETIADKFECDYGAKLQRDDSDLATKVIERCIDQRIPVYPVHDSFIVPKSCEEIVCYIMKEEFTRLFNWNIDISSK